jgi:hypothetical protein
MESIAKSVRLTWPQLTTKKIIAYQRKLKTDKL